MNKFTRISLSAAASLALVIGGGAVAANAATPASSPSSGTSCAAQVRAVWANAPAALKSDLKALKAMPAGKDRRADALKIHTKALDGGYGAGVEAKAKWLKAHKSERLRPLPANLKADLKTLHDDSKADKPAEAKKIAANALAGTYGANIESFAKFVQSHCAGS